uniref:peptidylprolyl isomerase n=1 Tax=Caenorhabditis tropicalis TaxID=1561998 RepID=A0A1I7UHZ0_9PELO
MEMISTAEKRVFLDISADEKQLGRIEVKLFTAEAPKTCENFRALCTGEAGRTPNNKAQLHYKGNEIHRIVKNFMIQGGDITEGDGRGGYSIYGRYFEDEKFELKHSKPYLLSMANKGPHSNSSQFFITTAPAPHCNRKHVVFGEVIKGREVVDMIENLEVDEKSKPYAKVRIYNCGELVKKQKMMKSNEEVSEMGDARNKKTDNSIPKDPKSWLSRDEKNNDRSRSPKKYKQRYSTKNDRDVECGYDRKRRDDRDSYRDRSEKHKDDVRIKVRGRGGVRYKRDRSLTPEHWRKNAPTKLIHSTSRSPQ